MRKIDEVLNAQLEIVQFLDNNKTSDLQGDELSRMVVKLATNNAYLGQEVARMEYELDMLGATRKVEWIREYQNARTSEEKISQKDSEIIADNAVSGICKQEVELKGQLLKSKNMRIDCKELQTALQSRMGQLKQERIDSSMPGIKC